MPAWSFHIKLASEVSAVLNLDEQEKNLFILSKICLRNSKLIF